MGKIIDDRFYLMAQETPEDVSVRIRPGRGGQRWASMREIRREGNRVAESLGYRGVEFGRVASGIGAEFLKGLKAEGVEVRR